jgi:hypothetical protein
MPQPIATLIAALVAATATAAGWVVSYAYGRRRDAQAKELELRVRYRQRQIEELYGPLFSLIEQVFSAAEVQDRILPEGKPALNNADQDRVRRFFWEQQFAPLHREIRELLRTKLYLLEGAELPESLSQYLEHATQEECQRRLWYESGVSTSHVAGQPWPRDFYEEIRLTLTRLMKEYQGILAQPNVSRVLVK